jgi:hypothetical protein
MAASRDNTAKRRADGRAQRRADAQSRRDASTQDDEARPSEDHEVADALRGAASAAVAGAAVGAARAFARRRGHEPEAHDEPAHEPEREEHLEPEPEPADDQSPAPVQERQPPLSGGQAREIIARAREELQELRGAEAESVSSLTRTADGWRVGLQVVEVHRIPESTDVLATYEVELDPGGRLVTFERTHRYVRSEADRE